MSYYGYPHPAPRHQTYRTGSRVITVTTGCEGPVHDPYSYTEYSVKRAGWADVTLHEGLAVWLRYTGKKGTNAEPKGLSDAASRKFFEKHLGCSLQHFERAIQRVRSRCRQCGLPPCQTVEGYPGESFDVCENGHVVNSDFDINAVL